MSAWMTIFQPIGLGHYMALSALLFFLGLVGILVRRNILVIYMCLELMLNSATLALVAASRYTAVGVDAQVMVFFVLTVAATEVAVGLALIVALFRLRHTIQAGEINTLKF